MTFRFVLLRGSIAASAALLAATSLPAPLPAQVAAGGSARARVSAPNGSALVPSALVGALSSASAHAGQPVVARLAQPARLADGSTLPQGSELLGHVTESRPLAGSDSISRLGLLFDGARMPSGEVRKIQALVQGVAPAGGASLPATDPAGPRAASTAAGASMESSDGTHTAPTGAVGAGAVGGLLGGVTGTVGQVAGAATSTVGGTLGAITGLPGVLLTGASGLLQARGQNVSLPANTQITLAVSAAK